jgi:hypothetical protein
MHHRIILSCFIISLALFSCQLENDEMKPFHPSYEYQDELCLQQFNEAFENRDTVIHITNQASLDTLRMFCFQIPDTIDFEIYDLVASYAAGTGCYVEFERNVIETVHTSEYTYLLELNIYDDCEALFESWNIILVPKLKDPYYRILRRVVKNNS